MREVFKKKRILLVDDSSSIRQIIKNRLVQIGFKSSNIKEAADGNHALGVLNGGEFDLIISDWNMPKMDGLSLLKSVKDNAKMSTIPFLMVSAETDKKQISEALELGADQYITKPFKTTTLKTTIIQLLIGTTTFADQKVMVVDDSQTMRRVVTKNLIQAGFHESDIFEAPDGEEALNLLSGEEVDLIISDWHMPKMDGLEFLKRVRASETRKDIPVLMVTAEMHKENILDAIKAGVSDYIIKPFNAIQLQDKVKKVFYSSSDE